MTANLPEPAGRELKAAKRIFRVERTEYAEIEVDVPALLEEWADEHRDADMTDDEFVQDVLWKIGVQDLMYSGAFVRVLDKDTEEMIQNV